MTGNNIFKKFLEACFLCNFSRSLHCASDRLDATVGRIPIIFLKFFLTHAGRWTKFAPGKSLRFFELFLEFTLFEFRFTVFFPLSCGVCVLLCFIIPILGNRYGPGVNSLRQKTWGGRILTLHLNYVAGYTGPLLFLFERTQQLLR